MDVLTGRPGGAPGGPGVPLPLAPAGPRDPGGRGRATGTDGRVVPAAGGLLVRGGAGGTRARLAALHAAADRADRAAAHLGRALDAVHQALAAARVDPKAPGVEQAAEPLAALARRHGGLPAWGGHASDLAAALREAARRYEAADDGVAAALRAAVIVAGHGLGEGGPLVSGLAGGGALVVGAGAARALVVLRVLRRTPGLVGLLLAAASGPAAQGRDGPAGLVARLVGGDGGLLPGTLGLPDAALVELLLPGVAAWLLASAPGDQPLLADPVRALAGGAVVAGAVGGALLGTRGAGVLVAPLAGPTSSGRQPPAPTGVGDLLRQVAELGDEPVASIGVQRLDHADGGTSWVVAVPGMRSMDLVGGADPMDNATNAALMAGAPDPMTEAVETAMLRAGVGPGDPVVLAGYSQGGMVVTRLAGRLGGTFSIAAVVTAGSPVGAMPVPASVPALHLEHAQDYVPALDGRPNPDRPSRTTVVRTLPASGGTADGAGPADVGAAHGSWRYVETADLVDAHDGRSVRAFTDALTGALGDGTAQASQQRYVVARAPAPAPAPGSG